DLVEVVLALGAGSTLAHLLDGGEQQANEDGDDGDDHQQLDQREAGAGTNPGHESPPNPSKESDEANATHPDGQVPGPLRSRPVCRGRVTTTIRRRTRAARHHPRKAARRMKSVPWRTIRTMERNTPRSGRASRRWRVVPVPIRQIKEF